MARGIFDPAKRYNCLVFGHCFDRSPIYIVLPGHFRADTIDYFDTLTHETSYAVFEVDPPERGEYPYHWAGTYKIPMSAIRNNPPIELADP